MAAQIEKLLFLMHYARYGKFTEKEVMSNPRDKKKLGTYEIYDFLY